MDKKAEMNAGGMIMLAVGIILVAVFAVAIATQQNVMTDAQAVVNESFSLTSCYAGSASGDEINESVAVCNQTLANIPSDWQVGDTTYDVFSVTITDEDGVELTEDTGYTLFAGTGIVQYLNDSETTALGSNETLVSYSFYDEGYNKDDGARGIAKLPLLFFVFAGLAFAVMGIREWLK